MQKGLHFYLKDCRDCTQSRKEILKGKCNEMSITHKNRPPTATMIPSLDNSTSSYIKGETEKERMLNRCLSKGKLFGDDSSSKPFNDELFIMSREAFEEIRREREPNTEKDTRGKVQDAEDANHDTEKEDAKHETKKESVETSVAKKALHIESGKHSKKRRSKSIEHAKPQNSDLPRRSCLAGSSRRRSKSIDNPLGSSRALKTQPADFVADFTAALSPPAADAKTRVRRSKSCDNDDHTPEIHHRRPRRSRSIDNSVRRSTDLSVESFTDFFTNSQEDPLNSSMASFEMSDGLLKSAAAASDDEADIDDDGSVPSTHATATPAATPTATPSGSGSKFLRRSLLSKAFSFRRINKNSSTFQRLDDDAPEVINVDTSTTNAQSEVKASSSLLPPLDEGVSTAMLSRPDDRTDANKSQPRRRVSLEHAKKLTKSATPTEKENTKRTSPTWMDAKKNPPRRCLSMDSKPTYRSVPPEKKEHKVHPQLLRLDENDQSMTLSEMESKKRTTRKHPPRRGLSLDMRTSRSASPTKKESRASSLLLPLDENAAHGTTVSANLLIDAPFKTRNHFKKRSPRRSASLDITSARAIRAKIIENATMREEKELCTISCLQLTVTGDAVMTPLRTPIFSQCEINVIRSSS